MTGWLLVKDGKLLAWLQARPHYCDRGRWKQMIELGIWRSDADPAPRYYFNLEGAKSETVAYLAAKKIDLQGATWHETDWDGEMRDILARIEREKASIPA